MKKYHTFKLPEMLSPSYLVTVEGSVQTPGVDFVISRGRLSLKHPVKKGTMIDVRCSARPPVREIMIITGQKERGKHG